MTVTVSYPGVYVQELPSGSHAIAGVATSITAFIGRAPRGPIDTAITINSQSDYERAFGGLDADSPMSFLVRDFYQNGGSQAVVVRLFHAATGSVAPTAIHDIGGIFKLIAANPGSWGRGIKIEIDRDVAEQVKTLLRPALPLNDGQVFNLKVSYGTAVEYHRNVTMVDTSRRIDKVLAAESEIVQFPPAALTKNISIISALSPTFDAALAPVINAAWAAKTTVKNAASPVAVQDGTFLTKDDDFAPPEAQHDKVGLYALEQVDLFNMLVIAPTVALNAAEPRILDNDLTVLALASTYVKDRRAVLLIDPPSAWKTKKAAKDGLAVAITTIAERSYAALYFPRVMYPDPFDDDRLRPFPPSGLIAGVIARTDAERGVWKAPAGLEAAIAGVFQLGVDLTDLENGELNPMAINCMRNKAGAGMVVWGARTLEGDDRMSSQWKYLPVRRMALFLEESLFRGSQWVVFEPNDEPLWSQIRTNFGAFMQGLFLQGAFQGQTPEEAYFVKCDDETTTQANIDNGIVNILVGFAPLKPAEFVVISLQQMAGQQGGG